MRLDLLVDLEDREIKEIKVRKDKMELMLLDQKVRKENHPL